VTKAAAHRKLDPHRALQRTVWAALAGTVVALAARGPLPELSLLLGWNVGGLVLLVLSWLPIVRSDERMTQERAGSEDPGRTLVYGIVTLASAASLFAAVSLSRRAALHAPDQAHLVVWLCLATVAQSWVLTHTAFTLRYARLYYREDHEGIGGVEFAGGHRPSYADFAYFAFTIGMTFQVSDTSITSAQIRRTVLLHALIAFVYNTAILAFVLTLVFGSVS
jgi:uncharacterized membrane protein